MDIHCIKYIHAISRRILSGGSRGIDWLNNLCKVFFRFSKDLHKFIAGLELTYADSNGCVQTIFLCLMQITVCIRHLERSIKMEEARGIELRASRDHFRDRIIWCLEQLTASIQSLAAGRNEMPSQMESSTFVDLMDAALDHLAPYSSYKERDTKVIETNAETLAVAKQIRATVNLIIGHTLAFANVALKTDKKALSALSQKVLRECIAFEDEYALSEREGKLNESNRKLKAATLENALYHLEDYINESLLRLVFTCFLDYGKLSISNLRAFMRTCKADDVALDELIADFDVNVDRTTQIGIFAIAFAPNVKTKISVRSCLASLETLDSVIIPSLQTNSCAGVFSEILEQHFKEEIEKFKHTLQEIIDSYAFATCYQEILMQCLTQMEKQFDKDQLHDIVQMGEFLSEHFQLKINNDELRKELDRVQLLGNFQLMLGECRAILNCADPVDEQRILKRFKILRSVLRKFSDSLKDSTSRSQRDTSNMFIMPDEVDDSEYMFESLGISPSIGSILYIQENPMRRRAVSDSIRGNYSKLPPTPRPSPLVWPERSNRNSIAEQGQIANSIKPKTMPAGLSHRDRCSSVRRKESLRTAMFKRQKSTETAKVYNIYKNHLDTYEINDILDQLTDISNIRSTDNIEN